VVFRSFLSSCCAKTVISADKWTANSGGMRPKLCSVIVLTDGLNGVARKHLRGEAGEEGHTGASRIGLIVIGVGLTILVFRRRLANLKRGIL
jgi:hypothetical protein